MASAVLQRHCNSITGALLPAMSALIWQRGLCLALLHAPLCNSTQPNSTSAMMSSWLNSIIQLIAKLVMDFGFHHHGMDLVELSLKPISAAHSMHSLPLHSSHSLPARCTTHTCARLSELNTSRRLMRYGALPQPQHICWRRKRGAQPACRR